ncbi:MAG: efflux RND transporter periplasmic adaptor subunit [Polyangiaceae bacterium]
MQQSVHEASAWHERCTSPQFMRALLLALSVLVGTLAAALVLVGVLRGTRATPPIPRDVPHMENGLIHFSTAYAKVAGLETARGTIGSLSPVIRVTGSVAFDPQRVSTIGARTPGRVIRVFKGLGDSVAAAEPLAQLESVELGKAQADLIAARTRTETAAANEDRQRKLLEGHATSLQDYESARAAAATAVAEERSTEHKIAALGGSQSGPTGLVALRSPIAGRVVEVHASAGQYVEPSFGAFRVADLRQVWIELAIFERDLPSVAVDQEVEISPQMEPETILHGQVAHVGDVIDPETRSAAVRVVVRNLAQALRPGQSVLAHIHTGPGKTKSLLVPEGAVVTVDGKPTVFVLRAPGAIEPRSITVGQHDGERVEVLAGLELNEEIAVKGTFALKSELFR